jgi:hypothetical protein
MNKKAYAFFLKKRRKKSNPIAKDLSDGRYHQRVVKDKTKYTRKEKHGQTNRHYEQSHSPKTSA